MLTKFSFMIFNTDGCVCSGVVGGRAVESCGVGGVGGVGGVRCALELCAWTGAAAMKTEYCADVYGGEWVLCLSFFFQNPYIQRDTPTSHTKYRQGLRASAVTFRRLL